MKKKIGFWMLLSFVLFSCAKEQEPEQIVRESGQAGPEAGYASLNAAIEADDDTRNSLEDADGKRYLLWSEGEIIGVTGNTSGNARASLETGFGGKASGTFWYNSEVVKGGVKYGYYPYTSDAYVSGTTLNVTLPDVQPYKEGSMIADNVLVRAGARESGEDLLVQVGNDEGVDDRSPAPFFSRGHRRSYRRHVAAHQDDVFSGAHRAGDHQTHLGGLQHGVGNLISGRDAVQLY